MLVSTLQTVTRYWTHSRCPSLQARCRAVLGFRLSTYIRTQWWCLETVKTTEFRREERSDKSKVCKDSLKNANFSKLFPLKKANHVIVRTPFKYHVNKANTERYRRSTVPYLQRIFGLWFHEIINICNIHFLQPASLALVWYGSKTFSKVAEMKFRLFFQLEYVEKHWFWDPGGLPSPMDTFPYSNRATGSL